MLDLKDFKVGFVLDFAVQSRLYIWSKVPYRMFPFARLALLACFAFLFKTQKTNA